MFFSLFQTRIGDDEMSLWANVASCIRWYLSFSLPCHISLVSLRVLRRGVLICPFFSFESPKKVRTRNEIQYSSQCKKRIVKGSKWWCRWREAMSHGEKNFWFLFFSSSCARNMSLLFPYQEKRGEFSEISRSKSTWMNTTVEHSRATTSLSDVEFFMNEILQFFLLLIGFFDLMWSFGVILSLTFSSHPFTPLLNQVNIRSNGGRCLVVFYTDYHIILYS